MDKIQKIEFDDKYELARNLQSKISSSKLSGGIFGETSNILKKFSRIKKSDLNEKDDVLAELGKYQKALEYNDKVLEIEPDHILAPDNKKMTIESLSQEKPAPIQKKIFISYAREDTDFAKYISKDLRNKGHDVLIDVNIIGIGEKWARSLEKKISDCDIFIVILTSDSLDSNFVEKEVLQALKENKIIVPCKFEDIEDKDIKWGLIDIEIIEFSDEFKLARKLNSKIKKYISI